MVNEIWETILMIISSITISLNKLLVFELIAVVKKAEIYFIRRGTIDFWTFRYSKGRVLIF